MPIVPIITGIVRDCTPSLRLGSLTRISLLAGDLDGVSGNPRWKA